MKHLFLILFFVSIDVSAQTDAQSIISDSNNYIAYLKDNNMEKVIDYLPPKIFELVSRESLLAEVKSIMENPDFSIAIEKIKMSKPSRIITDNNHKYAKINYSFYMIFRFKSATIDLDRFSSAIRSKYGEDNVKVDKIKKSIQIFINSSMYAIKEKDFNTWKFVRKDNSNPEMLKLVMPETIIKKLDELQ